MKYIQPKVFGSSFTCPHCGVLAKQDWWERNWAARQQPQSEYNPIRVACCQHCAQSTLWVMDTMCYPDATTAPPPNQEMPPTVLKLYSEAASIATKSPRGAAALLRLSIQVLCKELGEPGKDINTDIGSLVAKGLPKIVQQSLDVVRVTGNEAVHPGQIDTDDPETAQSLFRLVNIIVEYMIAMPRQVTGLFDGLPAQKLEGIAKRDQPKH